MTQPLLQTSGRLSAARLVQARPIPAQFPRTGVFALPERVQDCGARDGLVEAAADLSHDLPRSQRLVGVGQDLQNQICRPAKWPFQDDRRLMGRWCL
jgi:hypothetical protein